MIACGFGAWSVELAGCGLGAVGGLRAVGRGAWGVGRGAWAVGRGAWGVARPSGRAGWAHRDVGPPAVMRTKLGSRRGGLKTVGEAQG